MLLPHVQKAIDNAPQYIAGISFSDRTIRYVEVEKHKKNTLVISAFGHITIPYDVVTGGVVKDTVQFTETLRKLEISLHKEAHVVIRKDTDRAKRDALAVIGYKTIFEKEGIDALRGVFAPWNTDAKRICLFANYDVTYLLEVSEHGTILLERFNHKEFEQVRTVEIIRSYLSTVTDKSILLAGRYKDDSFIRRLTDFGIEIFNTNIWQNLIDFSVYVPEIPQDESYQYTVPVGLIVSRLMNDATQIITSTSFDPSTSQSIEKGTRQGTTEQTSDLADLLVDVIPLTKLEEDKRKSSEKRMPQKYKKLISK